MASLHRTIYTRLFSLSEIVRVVEVQTFVSITNPTCTHAQYNIHMKGHAYFSFITEAVLWHSVHEHSIIQLVSATSVTTQYKTWAEA
jgi:hypothetical protein